MKHVFLRILPLFLLLLMCAFRTGAQITPSNSSVQQDMNFVISADNANYDSLLNNYYLRKYTASVNKHYGKTVSNVYGDFASIPDSVLAARLRALPTVVPMTYNSTVRSYIRMYVGVMSRRLDVMLTLSEYYFPMFEETLSRYGVPDELKYLTIIESALNPQATSPVGAAGLWQFMYATGKHYGLEVNSLVDDRRDPMLSTNAAARYLRSLYNLYHDWTLAIAAYNCGPGGVNKAITRSGGKRDFWEIYDFLPKETRGYVPAYIAATYIMNYYQDHGLRPSKIEIPVHTDTIHMKDDALFCYIAKYSGMEVAELRTLNPQFRNDIVPVSSGRPAVYLPVNKIPLVIRYENAIVKDTRDSLTKKPAVVEKSSDSPTERVTYKVKKGDSLGKIANKYGVTQAELKKWNKRSSNTVKVGETLVIYRKNPNYRKPETSSSSNASASASSDSTAAATSAVTPKPAASAPKTTPVKYTVKQGDNLSKIAAKYNTSVDKIKSLNGMKDDKICVGQTIRVK